MMRPDAGIRFTCTSIGERKMLTCCQSPGGAALAVAAPATSTRPSAGDRTLSSSDGEVRSEERRVGKECGTRMATGQAEDGIRDRNVTGVQTCALPISDS